MPWPISFSNTDSAAVFLDDCVMSQGQALTRPFANLRPAVVKQFMEVTSDHFISAIAGHLQHSVIAESYIPFHIETAKPSTMAFRISCSSAFNSLSELSGIGPEAWIGLHLLHRQEGVSV